MTVYVNNWAGVDNDPLEFVVTVADNPGAATDAAQGGVSMSEALELYCSASTPGAFDNFNDGIAVSPAGAMRVLMCATGDGPPDGVCWIGGLPVTATGQLCLTADGTVDHYVSGWPVDVGGLVIAGTSIAIGELLLETGDFLLLEDGGKFEEE